MKMALDRWGVWLRRGWLWWGSFSLAALGVVVLFFFPATQDSVRYVGWLYEFVGAATVLIDVTKIRREHQLDSLWRQLMRYLRDIPIRNLAPGVNLSGSSTTHTSSSSSGFLTVGPAQNKRKLRERLELMEKELHDVKDKLKSLNDRVSAEEQSRVTADQAEAAVRLHGDLQIKNSIKDSEVSSLAPTTIGLVWVVIGMALTTGTPEVCTLLNCPSEQPCPVQRHEDQKPPLPAWPSVRT